ncbi:HMA2 domain-containing protein [Magnetospirillum sp. SS-4]|uniref:HMA2 domain-containing protein n=1 Tax=Magnetospirillum sp. SS-4 TaxID=2681465 RepID=UPI0015731EFE|nr:hypothetical protein [Magnetospirillum sp. SS-4]
MCIASHVPGRLRLRHPSLRSPVGNAGMAAILADWEGVISVEAKPVCASILLRYDPAVISPAGLDARIVALVEPGKAGEDGNPPASSDGGLSLWTLNRPAKIGMLVSLTGSLLALAAGKKYHAALGALHLVFLLVHLANHRKKILQ